jgi:hypothetical protein
MIPCAAIAVLALAGIASAADAVALVFAKGAGTLSQAEQIEIVKALDLRTADDGKSLVDTVCGQPATAEVEVRDLNGDKVEDVLVTSGNTCTSGMTGSSVAVFIKDKTGHYKPQLGFPGVFAEVRPAKGKAYPDLLIGGPGFCFARWRWNGTAYAEAGNEPQQPGGCDHLNQ